MTDAEVRQISDLAKLRVREYFDHYLTDIFPRQIKTLFESHNDDIEAHELKFRAHEKSCRPGAKLNRITWMVAGGTAVVSVVFTLFGERLLRALGLI
jgi:hypothetical protein